MRKNIFFILLILGISAYSQDTESIKLKLDELRKEKESIELRLNEINSLIKDNEILLKNAILQSSKQSNFICNTSIITNAKLKSTPELNGNIIEIIPKKKDVSVLEYAGNDYWKISYDNKVGFINEVFLKNTNEMISLKNSLLIDKKKLEDQQRIELKNKRKQELIDKYGSYYANNILNKNIVMGMTKEMVIEAIGQPDDNNITKGSWGTHEQWVYDKEDMYIYFENDKLTTIQK